MEMKSMRHHMDVNYWGTAEMAHAIMREWLDVSKPVEKEAKHLIMTGSICASYSPPGYTPYTPSKYAMRGLAECIQQEVLLYPQNVQVHLLLPGTILSPGNVRENENKPEITKIIEKDDPKQTPDEVAALSIKGLEAGQHNITVNFLGHLMKWSSFGGSPKNSFLDVFGTFLATIVWIFARPILDSQIKGHGKKHGHPSLHKKTRDA
jgi:3-dehydrosphinganine reductase